jgi:ethanolaminephosphotransferase
MAIWLIGICIFSIFGQGPHSLTIWGYHWIILVTLTGFYVAHWEKYITGVLFLPWAYDISQLVCLTTYILLEKHFGHIEVVSFF